jgi:omega-6 fatty acid desaturase (delta-12 desaturase)
MTSETPSISSRRAADWRHLVAPYQHTDGRRAFLQVATSYVPYFGLWVLMILSLKVSYWLTLGLAMLAAGFLLRVFIILHDCGHRAFIRSSRISDVLGFVAGVLTFVPYHYWRHNHAIHHATAGNLDQRGTGDIWTMTVGEYAQASRMKRLVYRLYRNPLVLFLIGPAFMFAVLYRFVPLGVGWRWQRSVLMTNLALLGVVVGLSLLIGFGNYLRIQIPIMLFSSVAGVWLFYVQHQFKDVYWERQTNWDFFATAMQGSSFYKLPRILQWFSGNIGFHHIHHLSPKIPNYLLEKCHRENPLFQEAKTLSLRESFETIRYRLWDEKKHELVAAGPAWL